MGTVRPAACLTVLACLPIPAQVLHYTGEWRLLEAGRVQAELGATSARLDLQTAGLADRLAAVRDSYTVNYEAASLCASASREKYRQGAKHRDISVTFASGKASRVERDLVRNGETVSSAELAVPGCVHDVLSALEKLRRTETRPGTRIMLPISDGRRSANVEVEAQERETIRTRAGVFTAVRHEAKLFNGVIFRRKARLFVWLTDDARRLPVQFRLQMPFYIGTVTLQLDKEGPG